MPISKSLLALLLVTLVPACAELLPDYVPPESVGPSWHSLFDGYSLGEWEPVDFGAQGEVSVRDRTLHVGVGELVSGVRYAGNLAGYLPASLEDYEIRLEAKRIQGNDFFCGLNFPVGTRDRVTLILGGWGGGIVGLSNLDGQHAAENRTTRFMTFLRDRWYAVGVRVTTEKIEVELDGQRIIEVVRESYREIDVRTEMREFLPLSLTTYRTHGAFRNIEVRPLPR